METIKMFPLKPNIICEMHGDIKIFPLKPTIICLCDAWRRHQNISKVSTQTNYNL